MKKKNLYSKVSGDFCLHCGETMYRINGLKRAEFCKNKDCQVYGMYAILASPVPLNKQKKK